MTRTILKVYQTGAASSNFKKLASFFSIYGFQIWVEMPLYFQLSLSWNAMKVAAACGINFPHSEGMLYMAVAHCQWNRHIYFRFQGFHTWKHLSQVSTLIG